MMMTELAAQHILPFHGAEHGEVFLCREILNHAIEQGEELGFLFLGKAFKGLPIYLIC